MKGPSQYLNCLIRIKEERFHTILDSETKDEDCKSIKSICEHVVNAGYGYSTYLPQNYTNLDSMRPRVSCLSVQEVEEAMWEMFSHIIETANNLSTIEEKELLTEFTVPWKQNYDAEQLLEHAMVHVLRNRRQLEKFDADYEFFQ